MALENLPLFNTMNREEVKPPFPHPHRPLTSQESHFVIMEKVNACIHEVNLFEQRVKHEIDIFLDKATQENTAFKEAIQASYNAFQEVVQREINNFELDIQNNFDLYRNDIDKRVADFEEAINNDFLTLQTNIIKLCDDKIAELEEFKVTLDNHYKELNAQVIATTNAKIEELETLKIELNNGYVNFKNTINDIVRDFKNTVTNHMSVQDGKIEEYKEYMVDNILDSTEKVFDKKAKNGEISAIMTAVYGDSRVFKGSLSYDEIQAITDASNGDYYYCTSDEHYYQRTENAWVDIGTGEMIADSFVKFVEAFNNGTAFKPSTIEPKTMKGFTNLINNNVEITREQSVMILNNNEISGEINGDEYEALTYYGIEPNKTYALLIDMEGTEKPWAIGAVYNGDTWNAMTGHGSTENKKILIFETGDTVNNLGRSLLGFTTTEMMGEVITAKFYLFDVTNLNDLFTSEIPYTFDEMLNSTFLFSVYSSLSEKALTANNATNAKNASYALLPEIEITNSMVSKFSSTLDKVDGGDITFTATTNYGGFMVTLPEMYKDLIFICEADKADERIKLGFINKSYAWDTSETVKTEIINGKNVAVVKLTATDNAHKMVGCTLSGATDYSTQRTFKLHLIDASFIDEVNEIIISAVIDENPHLILEYIANAQTNASILPLKGKKVLCIGDSITAARQWQNVLANNGAEITTHALGGIGITACVDGTGSLEALSMADVHDKDFIILLAGYNNRGTNDGEIGDCWVSDGTGQATIAGYIQYVINRIYELLAGGEENGTTYNANLNAKLLIVTPHCAGKYPYRDVDGYGEYPDGSGLTMETMSNIIRDVANYNNIPACDLWHYSGINKFTWTIYGANPNAYIENPTNTDTPYPNNGDQLHCSSAGYQRIGETIYSALRSYYNI